MLKTIGQHVCDNRGNGKQIEESGKPAAHSLYNPKEKKNPFLGSGYYFWDYNIEMARYWGKKQYNDKYYIFQAEISCVEEVLLDLVGNRKHMEYLVNLMELFKSKNENSVHWPIGKFIEFLKEISLQDDKFKEILQFKSIRAVDHSAGMSNERSFDEKTKATINMNPRIIICITEVTSVTLWDFKLIETK